MIELLIVVRKLGTFQVIDIFPNSLTITCGVCRVDVTGGKVGA